MQREYNESNHQYSRTNTDRDSHMIVSSRTTLHMPDKHIHGVPKKRDYILYNNFNNKCPITIVFGIVTSKSMRHR